MAAASEEAIKQFSVLMEQRESSALVLLLFFFAKKKDLFSSPVFLGH